ncbi:DMT family transporter [Oryzifoliimicrobium ureilyticus]|uniref:DMT family transporter n=1 Tax=Oryzifoliimicrobium ureilyticus TaxID=3113724 RepID=UPI0030766FB0
MHRLAYISLLAATLFWGGNTVAGKLALGHISPMMLISLRWLLATTLIFASSVQTLKRDWPVARQHLPLFLLLGATGFTLFNAMLYSAAHYTTAINIAIEQAGIPMLIFLLNFLWFRTRVSLAQLFGFVLTLAGVGLTATHGDPMSLLSIGVNFGDGLMLIAVAAYALYTIFLRFKPQVHWRTMMAFPALGAFLSSLPPLIWEAQRGALVVPDPAGWAIIIYTALFASLAAQTLYVFAVGRIGANRASLFINLVPVFGTLISILVLGEALHAFHVVALILAISGIAIAEWGRPRIAA